MKHLIKVLPLAILGLMISMSSFGQQKSARDKAYDQAALLKQKLSLSNEVASQVEDIELKYADVRGKAITDNDGKKTTLDGDIKKVLTADQYKKYKELLKQQKDEADSQKEVDKMQKEQNKIMRDMNKSSSSSRSKIK